MKLFLLQQLIDEPGKPVVDSKLVHYSVSVVVL